MFTTNDTPLQRRYYVADIERGTGNYLKQQPVLKSCFYFLWSNQFTGHNNGNDVPRSMFISFPASLLTRGGGKGHTLIPFGGQARVEEGGSVIKGKYNSKETHPPQTRMG